MKYEANLKHRLDQANIISSARRAALLEGKKEGMKEGKIEMIFEMKKNGFDNTLIAKISGLPIEEIEEIVKSK